MRRAEYYRHQIGVMIHGNSNGAFGKDEAVFTLQELAAEARQEAQELMDVAQEAETTASSLPDDADNPVFGNEGGTDKGLSSVIDALERG